MTFEERMDRITERHEALAQSVELLSHQMRNLEAKTEVLIESQAVMQKELRTVGNLLGEFSGRVSATFERLSELTISHQAQLNHHEQRLNTLEGNA